MNKGTILVVAGGTFGHIKPAILLKKKLEKESYKVFLIVSYQDKKFQGVIQEKRTYFIRLSGLPRTKNIFKLFFFANKLGLSLLKVLYYFLVLRPKKVISTGGFTAFPALFIAKLIKIPFYLLEQNSVMGLVHRLFYNYADKIFLSMNIINLKNTNLKRSEIVGNPVELKFSSQNQALKQLDLPTKWLGSKVISVFGGSLGALSICQWLIEAKNQLQEENIKIVLVTGEKQYHKFKIYQDSDFYIFSFIEDMEALYNASNIIISRAGASSISELLFFQKPTIFIPYPYASDNHQFHNALFASRYLKSIIIQDKDLALYKIDDLLNSLEKEQEPNEFFNNQALDKILIALK